jgi:hypothetical protein
MSSNSGLLADCRAARDRRRSGVRLRHVSPWTVVSSIYYQSWKRTFADGTQQILVENGCWSLKTMFHDSRGTHESAHWGRNEAMEAADHAGVRKSWQMPAEAKETAYAVPPSITLADLSSAKADVSP